MDNNNNNLVVRVAVGMRLGLSLCIPHNCITVTVHTTQLSVVVPWDFSGCHSRRHWEKSQDTTV